MSKHEQVIALDSIVGDDETDTRLLREMANEAERYIRSFAWCLQLNEGFFTDGFGGVVAIFLFRGDIANLGKDQWTWVLVGDIPSVYLEMDDEHVSPHDALHRYIEGIEKWITAARSGLSLQELIPIDAPTDPNVLDVLTGRIDTLRKHILPHISKSSFHTGPWSRQ
jgi:hypothetical protein